jgi:RNA polymerase sigma factor (sigma-70 family)
MLDHRNFLANEPATVHFFVHAARRWARKFFGDPAKVDSVVQAALLEMTRRLRAGEEPPPERLGYWIYGCTNNAVRRELTRMRRDVFTSFESSVHGQLPVDISQAFRLQQELEEIERLLEQHTEARVREMLVDHVRGVSYRELAKLHELGEGAARESVCRVRKRLRGALTAREKLECLTQLATRAGLKPPSTPSNS